MRRLVEAAVVIGTLSLLVLGMLTSCGGLCDCPFGMACVVISPGLVECRPNPTPSAAVAVDGGVR